MKTYQCKICKEYIDWSDVKSRMIITEDIITEKEERRIKRYYICDDCQDKIKLILKI